MELPDASIQYSELPQALLDETITQLRNFSTCFVVENKLAGSGTFVRVNGIPGILTAQHVWRNVVELAGATREVGLLIAHTGHTFTVPLDTLVPRLKPTVADSDRGPDLQFVELPRAKLGEIEARKSFFNLSVDSSQRLEEAESRHGLLVVMGFPDNRIRTIEDKLERRRSHVFFNLGLGVLQERVEEREGFDYVDLNTGPSKTSNDYRGVSGGGVWRVIYAKRLEDSAKDAFIKTLLLCGVAFYQSEMRGDSRLIRAHGPQSLYLRLPALL